MKLKNAIAKLSKITEVQHDTKRNEYYGIVKGNVINFYANTNAYGLDSTVQIIRVRSINDHDDSQSDYSAGTFCDNLAQATRLASM